jgi:tetratricopeptide (TPR) repeat protein
MLGELRDDTPSVSLQKKIAAVFSQGHLAVLLLYLGWPDKAETVKQRILTRPRTFTHPLSLADNLYQAAFIEVFHNRVGEVKALSQTILEYACEQGLKWYIPIGQMLHGWATVKEGSVKDGLAELHQGLSTYRATETELSLTFFLAQSADALAAAGLYDQALESVTEGLALAEGTGERYYESELHRLKGELLLKTHGGDSSSLSAQAEAAFQTAVQLSRQQTAKSLELRAAMSLARLWQRQGKTAEALQLLSEIYDWFTEGFDSTDLNETRVLLGELQPLVSTGSLPH